MLGCRGVVVIGMLVCIGCGNTSETNFGSGGAAGSTAAGGTGNSGGINGSAASGPDGGTTGASGGSPGVGGSSSGGVTGTGGTGGTGATGTTGGTGGTLSLPPADKIDLLFLVDNSASMANDQALLSGSVPALIDRLVNPDCVDPSGNHTPGTSTCPSGGHREFAPVTDLHVGVITSSLGGHGADLCSANSTQFKPEQDDQAHLLPTVRTGLPSFNNLGFLAWNSTAGAPAGSLTDPATLKQELTGEVNAAGESGCGFEATLEAVYRFLVDPDPPSGVTVVNTIATVAYPDQTVLAQRASFLRPDSLVGIVILSDENDCSIVDGGIAWIVGSSTISSHQFRMFAATSACATDPNSPCCRSCGVAEGTPPSGCVALNLDPVCVASKTLSATEDPLNLRCWDQKRRFGLDLLYPVQRYIAGLTVPTVTNRAGTVVHNPLFYDTATSTQRRDASRVFTLGIVGVPWHDIATDASLTGVGLRYLTPAELRSGGRWSVILGDPAANPAVLPRDPLMIESEAARVGTSPIVNRPLAPATSTNPQENPINGHEYTPSATAGDLQYACIYPFATPVTCTANAPACDCPPDSDGGITGLTAANRPVCQPPSGGAPGTTQYYGKAYPGLRELQLLHGLGDNGVVSSLCAKYSTNTSDPDFGFKPAFDALLGRMSGQLVAP